MAPSPVKFFIILLISCVCGWIVFIFIARLIAWILSRILGASVGFRVAGCNILRDFNLRFKKGPLESLSVGEIKLSLRKSLVELGFSFISKDPKLHLLISELDVVMRPSASRGKKSQLRQHKKLHSTGSRGTWFIVVNVARFLSISVTDLIVKVPKVVLEVKDLKVDVAKDNGSDPALFLKVKLSSIFVRIRESREGCDLLGSFSQDENPPGGTYTSVMDMMPASCICKELLFSSEFYYDRVNGVMSRNVDIATGDVAVTLTEKLILGSQGLTDEKDNLCSIRSSKNAGKQKSRAGKLNSLDSSTKFVAKLPEKASFIMPKLDVTIIFRAHDLSFESNVMGVQLKTSKSQVYEESGDTAAHLDIQMDLSEIHLLRDEQISVVEILRLAVVSSVDISSEMASPVRAEIDVKLGGTRCNLIVSRLRQWMRIQMQVNKKAVVQEEAAITESDNNSERSLDTGAKPLMWACTVSAPEMSIVLYNLNGSPLYHGCSQSSHLYANNIATRKIQVHGELGEINLHMTDEYQECPMENMFGMETNSGSLMHVARVSFDWGHKELESVEVKNETKKWRLILKVDVTGMGIFFSVQRIEALVLSMVQFKALLKALTFRKSTFHKGARGRPNKSLKGTSLMRFNLERCSVNFFGDAKIENAIIADPKKVNFGSQGGQVIISNSADGLPRTARISSTASGDACCLKYSASLDVFHFSVCMNKEKHSLEMDVERARCVYQDHTEEYEANIRRTLLDMRNVKFIRRTGGHNEVAVCSLFRATDILVRWEPDVHLLLYELVLRLRSIAQSQKCYLDDPSEIKGMELEKPDAIQPSKQLKKESVFAVDVELLKVSAELADGVETMMEVQSIFSENARIGVLLEGLTFGFNDARVIQSSRLQISRLPSVPSSGGSWDWVIRGLDIRIFMPYRLQLRAIEDAVEDTFRGLKLITSAMASSLGCVPSKVSKKSRSKSCEVGGVSFVIRKLTAEVEDEPLQGWLDEHYQLIKSTVCELDVRLGLLEEMISEGINLANLDQNVNSVARKVCFDGTEVDVNDKMAVKKLHDEIHKKAFRLYYDACQRLVFSGGSGACRSGFQAGFKPSVSRSSLLSVCATELDLTLKRIDGGDSGMIDFVKKQDPVCAQNDIPFSRLFGKNVILKTTSLIVQIRDYHFPIFSAVGGSCEGCVVLAQQATSFQPQIEQDVFVGNWWRVRMLRSASGTTPALKTYTDLPIFFEKSEIAFGVGFEPVLADISYAFTVALRRASLGHRGGPHSLRAVAQPKKEKSLPWWDDVRYYMHGKIGLSFNQTIWHLLATTNPYEKLDKAQIVSGCMDIQQSDGRVTLFANDFKIFITSLGSLMKNCTLKLPTTFSVPLIETPAFYVEVTMDWECESGNPLDHYLHSLPHEGAPHAKVWDPFRSTSLGLRFHFTLRPASLPCGNGQSEPSIMNGPGACSGIDQIMDSPTLSFGPHDLVWIFRWWSTYYVPPHKLRSFSRWPRYGLPRIPRSGNLSLDKVMTECFLRVDMMPACIRHMPLGKDDPANGLTFKTTKLKYELCYSRGRQKWTFDSRRDPLDLVYQGFDLHMLNGFINKEKDKFGASDIQVPGECLPAQLIGKAYPPKYVTNRVSDDGFLLSSDFFTIRKQAPKADPTRLLPWQDAGKRTIEMSYVRSEFENGSESDHTRSDPSDDDGFNVVIADNCQRVFVYGLKLLWTLKNRDAVWAWVGGVSKAFEPPKPSPSRQYTQRQLFKEVEARDQVKEPDDDNIKGSPSGVQDMTTQSFETEESRSSPSSSLRAESSSDTFMKPGNIDDSEEEGTRHFMVNVVQPQFNLHSEDANGRFLLAAANGRVLARSFHAVLNVGYEMIKKALYTEGIQIPESEPEMTWKRVELSVMLEHVQAHVAPTDVDPGAGLQWLPKILRSSPKVKRTGALLERVFTPCTMYFRYTRHKGGTAELKVKPLKELTFNSPNITATMTSRQFQVMVDVLTNLLFARLPKPQKNSLSYTSDDDEDDVREEADEVVPDGVEEVELARINLERTERERSLLLDDIRTLAACENCSADPAVSPERGHDVWMMHCETTTLVLQLKKLLGKKQKARKEAAVLLRIALHKAAHVRLMEKEKNKSPSCAMRISLRIDKVVWGMLADGKHFAEAEISSMIYAFDRDYRDVGVAQFTTKLFVVRNCLPNAKCDMLLCAWNPPPEWGKKVMLRVDAKQGAPKDGSSPLDLFQVDIYPLKIHLTEPMYRMMWEYFFPEEEQDSQRRQEIWKVSTTAGLRAGLRRVRKFSTAEGPASNVRPTKESDIQAKLPHAASQAGPGHELSNHTVHVDGLGAQVSMLQNLKANIVCGSGTELRRTSSFDRLDEIFEERMVNEVILSTMSPTRNNVHPTPDNQQLVLEEVPKNKLKDKSAKLGRTSHDDKKPAKTPEEKKVRARKMMEFHNIKISQVELLVTYEGSRFAVSELRLLMDTFERVEFTGTWRRLFSRVKKHIIWGVLKSVTGMQGKKFKDKTHSQMESAGPSVPDSDLNFSDSEGHLERPDQLPISFLKRPTDGAGEGFVTSIRGLFNSQRRKAKALLRTMRGDAENGLRGEWSESDTEYSAFARQLTITKAKRLIRRHTKKFRSRGHNGFVPQRDSLVLSPREMSPSESDSSDEMSPNDAFP